MRFLGAAARGDWWGRFAWMTLGATLGAGAMLAVLGREPFGVSTGAMPPVHRPADRREVPVASRPGAGASAAMGQPQARKTLNEILAAGGPSFRLQERVADWSASASADDLIAALQDVDEWPRLKSESASRVVDRLLNRLAQLDGAEAVTMAGLLRPLESGGDDYVETAYESWLAESPEAAVEHIFKSDTWRGDRENDFLTRMLEQLSDSDSRYADVVAETMAWSGDPLFTEVARSRRADIFDSALEGNASMQFLNEWIAAGRFTPEEIADLHSRLARWAVNGDGDPQRLAQLMDQGLMIDESLRWDTIRISGQVDVARATKFLLSQSKPETLADELVNLLDAQAEDAPSLQRQTTEWLVANYHGEDRETLLSEASRKLMDSDLGLAWRAASAMTNDHLKFSSTYAVGFDWLAKDPKTARATLPPEIVQRYDLIHELYSAATTGFPPDVKLQLSFSK